MLEKRKECGLGDGKNCTIYYKQKTAPSVFSGTFVDWRIIVEGEKK